MDKRILSDEQKEMLRQTAKGRSRNSRGQFVDTVTAQEARIAELKKERDWYLFQGLTAEKGRRVAIRNAALQTIVISFTAAVIAFFVGRWAK